MTITTINVYIKKNSDSVKYDDDSQAASFTL